MAMDYTKNTFYKKKNDNNEIEYYLKINNTLINVSKEVYYVCFNSYRSELNALRKEVANSVLHCEDMDKATFFLSNNRNDFLDRIYYTEIINFCFSLLTTEEVKIFTSLLLEKSLSTISAELGIPKSTVYDKKVKIYKKLNKELKKYLNYPDDFPF